MNLTAIKKHLFYEEILKDLHTGIQNILFAEAMVQSAIGQYRYVFYVIDGRKKSFIRNMSRLCGVSFYQHFDIPNKMFYQLIRNMCFIDQERAESVMTAEGLKKFKEFHDYYKFYEGYEK